MKKELQKFFCFLYLFSLTGLVGAQTNTTNPKYKNFYQQVPPIETEEMTIEVYDPHSAAEFTLMKIKVINKSTDFILFKTSEVVYKYTHGLYSSSKSKIEFNSYLDGMDVIKPLDSAIFILRASAAGNNKFLVEKLSVMLNGFYHVKQEGTPQTGEELVLPATVAEDELIMGTFKARQTKIRKETDQTYAQYKCIYEGDQVGIVFPAKVTASLKDGRTFKNSFSNLSPILFTKGDEGKLDMNFKVPSHMIDKQKENIKINWNDAFSESMRQPIKIAPINLVLDPKKTAERNKF